MAIITIELSHIISINEKLSSNELKELKTKKSIEEIREFLQKKECTIVNDVKSFKNNVINLSSAELDKETSEFLNDLNRLLELDRYEKS